MAKQRLHCKEVIRLIDSHAGELDREVTEHIKSCPSCARAAEAAGVLRNTLDAATNNDIGDATPFDRIRSRTEAAVNARKENIMEKVKNQVGTRPRLIAGLGLAIVVFLFITLVPFSYTITVGYEVAFTNIENLEQIPAERVINAVKTLGYDKARIKVFPGQMTIGNLPSYLAAKEVSAAVRTVTGIEAVPEIVPIRQTVSGSLYAQVMDKMKIEVSTEGKTDAEIAEEIRQKLIANGFDEADVKVTSEGDEKKIDVSVSRSGAEGEQETESRIELKLIDEGSDISFDAPQPAERLEIDAKGKTNEEIKAEIEAKLAAEGKEGAKVEVTTNADGQRQIKVEFEKEDKK